jgi:L-amino acid N-acyltransferase YncA
MAFQPEPIPWESHLLWFENKLQSATSNLYILETDAGSPAGQIRFDLVEDGVFEVDVSISSELRGQGAGRSILSLAEHELRKTIPIARTLRARVKASNSASLALFRSAGYEEKSITTGPSGTEIALFEKKL